MRAVVQRVAQAEVTVDEAAVGRCEAGLLVYVGVAMGDGPADATALASKVRYLRIFPDAAGKMNLDVCQSGGSVLAVSNFTLLADASQGRRPAFTSAAPPEEAERLFEQFCAALRELGVHVEQGRFGASMRVASINAGPVNLLLDTRSGGSDRINRI
ncbi:MAG: D-aminoacyl-tRNA deacylase [Phycisphaerae bacterium]|nr:MAG: D-tyrosyl-tRNA(Tyr) deacylase [Planctomycetia bacterium]RIK71754.1 MAG: D-tyrosyl-tRNA(Tyr) deacylase [Planctomycetota bacterium]GJQ25455.1 MAG: D-aminoacyl-tRNA deacylase [Phycisphaerae bacterium]